MSTSRSHLSSPITARALLLSVVALVVLLGTYSIASAVAPTVTGVSPASGPAGTVVTITGTDFTGATAVYFGIDAATPTSVTATKVTVTAPAHAPGLVNVTVQNGDGTSPVVAAGQFTYTTALPAVTGVSPASGPVGTLVTVTGTGFTGASSVSFGGTLTAPASVSAVQVTAFAPAHALGLVDIQITATAGTSPVVVADRFTYTSGQPAVTGVSPGSGTAGTLVTISGSGFTGATSVNFGASSSAPTSVTDIQITVIAPVHQVGQVDVFVTTPSGTSPAATAARFTYVAAGTPVVSAVSPSSGVAGTVVTITGTGFTGATAVAFGVASAAGNVLSDTLITITAPAHAAGVVAVTVTNPIGTSAPTPASQFTYTASSGPVITSVTPSSGPITGGTMVVITGSGFTGATAVVFGASSATFTVNGDGQIVATSPARAAGLVNVQVSTATNSSANSPSNRFTYLAIDVTVNGVNPSSGSSSGGTSVSISGSGFTGATSVSFGGVAAAFSVTSDTQLTALSPFHVVGTVDIRVSSPVGTSPNTSADNFTYTMDFCPEAPLWVNDLLYGSIGGGFYWDQISGQVWTGQRSWHLFSPQPLRLAPQPLWVNALSYGSAGGGFYWDPVSGQVWTAERGWHLYQAQSCIARP